MLTSLTIKNYALIHNLKIDFSAGLSIITVETGAGKSILLGALGLVLGNRADVKSLRNKDVKCVVEAEFLIDSYNLHQYFNVLNVDYDSQTIIRREILPSGKSRAFVNDTPITLAVLSKLKTKLMDVHSQHQTIELSETDYQFSVLDAFAKHQPLLKQYHTDLQSLNSLKADLLQLSAKQQEANQQQDYQLFLLNELELAQVKVGELSDLEESLQKLSNAEEIKGVLSECIGIATHDEIGIQNLVHNLSNQMSKISSFSPVYEAIEDRLSSVKIELDDVFADIENANDSLSVDPNELERVNDRLQLIYSLFKKHNVTSIEELLRIWEVLSEKIHLSETCEAAILAKEEAISNIKNSLDTLALKISNARKKFAPKLAEQLRVLLVDLGMSNARFNIQITAGENYFHNGKDTLSFLFSANKGGDFGLLKKVASGGELSRIMLSIKKILSENTELPTIIFDEIDTGVSGEVSNKMASIMHQMATHMQVIAITHLPQIAAKGTQHYKVFKEDSEGATTTRLKLLTKEERILEIAEMISGKNISASAISHAKELLN